MAEKLKGGLADGKPTTKYNAKELKKGISVEKEHTPDKSVAREIAKDHLEEIPDYYTRLRKMESQAEKKMNKSASNNYFFNGFEKKARDNRDRRQRMSDAMVAGGTGMIGGQLVSKGVGTGSRTLMARTLRGASDADINKLTQQYQREGHLPKNLDISKLPGSDLQKGMSPNEKMRTTMRANPHYNPIGSTVQSMNSLGVHGHELGHASNTVRSRTSKAISAASGPSKQLGNLAATPAGLLGVLGSDNETVRNLSVAAPLAMAAPNLIEEGSASYRSLKNISKAFNKKRALKELPSLLGALGTYSAKPIGQATGLYAAKKVQDKLKSEGNK